MGATGEDLAHRWRRLFADRYAERLAALEEATAAPGSLYLDVIELYNVDPSLTRTLLAQPDWGLRVAEEVLNRMVDTGEGANVRLENHPGLLPIDGVRARHLGELVAVDGAVTSVQPVRVAPRHPVLSCPACGTSSVDASALVPATTRGRCPSCGRTGSLRLDRSATTMVNVRDIELGSGDDLDTAEDHRLRVILGDDIVDASGPGDRIRVTGIARAMPTSTPGRYAIGIEASSVSEEPAAPGATSEPPELKRLIESTWSNLDG